MEGMVKTSSIVELQHVLSRKRFRFIVECRQQQFVVLADPAHPYQRVRVLQNGRVQYSDQSAKDCLWELIPQQVACGEESSSSSSSRLVRVRASNGVARGGFLGVEDGQLLLARNDDDAQHDCDALDFLLKVVAADPVMQLLE